MYLPSLLPVALLAHSVAASLTIEELCQYQLPHKQPAIICLRADQPLDKFPKEISGTAEIGATDVKLCCPVGDTCLLNNATTPEVMCYDPVTTFGTSRLDSTKCSLANMTCGSDGYMEISTNGVFTVTSVKDGVGSTSGSSTNSASATGTGKPSMGTRVGMELGMGLGSGGVMVLGMLLGGWML